MAREAVSDEPSSIEELRRRVYNPDATDEDRERYRAAVAAAEPAAAAVAVEAPPAVTPPRAGRRSWLLLAGAVAVVVAVAASIAVLLPHAPALLSAPRPPAATIAVDGETRSEFVQNLAGGGAAGIAAYLVTHPSPPNLRGGTRYFTIERHGTGPQLIVLDPGPPEAVTGRATVILIAEWAGAAGWTAYRYRFGGDGLATLEPEAGRAGSQEGGVPTTATFSYRSGDRPVRLRIDVPDGVRWGAAVVFSD